MNKMGPKTNKLTIFTTPPHFPAPFQLSGMWHKADRMQILERLQQTLGRR
jgi:hypothetical protein